MRSSLTDFVCLGLGLYPLARTAIRVKRSGSVKESKMGKTGRLYSPEFKEEALRLVYASEKCYPVANIASSCG